MKKIDIEKLLLNNENEILEFKSARRDFNNEKLGNIFLPYQTKPH